MAWCSKAAFFCEGGLHKREAIGAIDGNYMFE